MINKETQLCISIAEKPSNFGTTLHNMAYEALDLNFIYKAFEISNLEGAIAGVRALGIRGCSVSMPFKQAVIPLLDVLDETAERTGAVNTIVNDGTFLTGFNTDLIGARLVLTSLIPKSEERILVLGAGGVARAILVALREMGCSNVVVANRDLGKITSLKTIMNCSAIPWLARQERQVQLLINATSIGMTPDVQNMPVDIEFINSTRAVMDVVTSPMETSLIACARKAGKVVVSGYQMSLEQAAAQFFLYTGMPAPRVVMEVGIRKLMNEQGDVTSAARSPKVTDF
jgi:shikimate dehydrogenase